MWYTTDRKKVSASWHEATATTPRPASSSWIISSATASTRSARPISSSTSKPRAPAPTPPPSTAIWTSWPESSGFWGILVLVGPPHADGPLLHHGQLYPGAVLPFQHGHCFGDGIGAGLDGDDLPLHPGRIMILWRIEGVSCTVPMMSPPTTWVPGSTTAWKSHFFSRSSGHLHTSGGGYFPSPSP
mgnify:CR=1 FL=1